MFEDNQQVVPDALYPELAAAIDAIPLHPAAGGTAAESGARVRALAALSRRLDARVHGALASFDGQGFASVQGAASTACWWAAHGKLNRGQAGRMVAAARLMAVLPKLTEVFSAGTIGVEHLNAVVAGSRRIPDEVLALADGTLRDFCGSANPAEMRRVTERLQALHDAAAVEDNAEYVHDNRSLTLARTFGGAWHLDALLEPESGAMLAAALDSLNHKRGPEDDRPAQARNADALTEILDLALRSAKLPDSGGDRPRVTLLVPVPTAGADIRTATGGSATERAATEGTATEGTDSEDPRTLRLPAQRASGSDCPGFVLPGSADLSRVVMFDHNARLLSTDSLLPAETIERICCDADLSIALLSDITGEPLAQGTEHRYADKPQRRALVVRDGGCVFPTCDRPPAHCHAHHLHPWEEHGPTDQCNLCLVCSFHHHLVHEGHWILRALPASPEHPTGAWQATAPHGYQLTQDRRPAT